MKRPAAVVPTPANAHLRTDFILPPLSVARVPGGHDERYRSIDGEGLRRRPRADVLHMLLLPFRISIDAYLTYQA